MTFIRKRRILWAYLFQMVIVFFILFSAYSESGYLTRLTSHNKTILCISPGVSMSVREAAESLSASLSFIKDHHLLEKIWLSVERIHSSELFTNTALEISSRVYNIFYILTTIHAP